MEFLYMKNERLIGFRTTADLAARIAALAEHECLSISDIARRATKRRKPSDPCLRLAPRELRVILDGLFELVIGFVGHVVLENVQNKAFLDRLTHRVEMERMSDLQIAKDSGFSS